MKPFSINLFSPDYFADPYPLYSHLRETAPVYWAEAYGFWVMTKYHDVVRILDDTRFTRSIKAWDKFRPIFEQLPDSPVKRDFDSSISQVDEPEHSRIRDVVKKAFTRQRAESMRSDAQAIANVFVDELCESLELDLHERLSLLLPVKVLSGFLGIPKDAEGEFVNLAWTSLRPTHPQASSQEIADGIQAINSIEAMIERLLAERRRNPQDDLLSLMQPALGLSEIQSFIRALIVAGAEPPGNLLDLGVMTLYQHGEQLAMLRAEPSLISNAVEEILRFNHVGRFIQRIAREDVQFDGHTIRKGQMVLAGIAAAHRDPEVFTNPDSFDIRRLPKHNIPFGTGRFTCLAKHLAHVQAEVALGTIVRRLPDLQFDVGRIEWEINIFLRKMKRFPVRAQCPLR
jgi:cytochrome P450